MYKTLSVLVISSVVLAGCGQSRLNPLNWFGGATSVATVDEAKRAENKRATRNPLIPETNRLTSRDEPYRGVLVANIKSLKIERTVGGALIHVTGVGAEQGSHEVRLEALNDGEPVDGVLVYELNAVPHYLGPDRTPKIGSERTRLINAASFVSDQTLASVRSIEVRGANNTLVSRR